MSKRFVLALATLLLSALPMFAADAPPQGPVPQTSAAAATSTTAAIEAPALCQASRSELAAPPLLPAARNLTLFTCGVCSGLCAGKVEGSICKTVSGRNWVCISLGDVCSDHLDQCGCTTSTGRPPE
jgi:hypothetical protein